MKHSSRFFTCLFIFIFTVAAYAQENEATVAKEKKYELRPEFTLRGSLGLFNSDHRISGGVNINGKRTAGLMLGHHYTYYDHVPGDLDAIITALFYRRYFHLGKRKICAFYVDAYAGVGVVYKVTGNEYKEDGTPIIAEPGEVIPIFGLQPGFRIRCYRNLHLFFGPSIATDCIGVHIGIGL